MKVEISDVDKRELADFIGNLVVSIRDDLSNDSPQDLPFRQTNCILEQYGLEVAEVDYAHCGIDVWTR